MKVILAGSAVIQLELNKDLLNKMKCKKCGKQDKAGRGYMRNGLCRKCNIKSAEKYLTKLWTLTR